jgi:hypothetical protein
MPRQSLPRFVWVLFACALAVGATSCSKSDRQGRAAPIGLPTLRLPEPKYDFGQVVEGGKITHFFTQLGIGTVTNWRAPQKLLFP